MLKTRILSRNKSSIQSSVGRCLQLFDGRAARDRLINLYRCTKQTRKIGCSEDRSLRWAHEKCGQTWKC